MKNIWIFSPIPSNYCKRRFGFRYKTWICLNVELVLLRVDILLPGTRCYVSTFSTKNWHVKTVSIKFWYVSTFSTKLWYVSTFSTKFWYVLTFSTKFWYVSVFSTQRKKYSTGFDPVHICFDFLDQNSICCNFLDGLDRHFKKLFVQPRIDMFRRSRPNMGIYRLSRL